MGKGVTCDYVDHGSSECRYINELRGRRVTCDHLGEDHAYTSTIGVRVNIDRFGRYVGTAGFVTHRFLANFTGSVEIDELPTMFSSRSVISLEGFVLL